MILYFSGTGNSRYVARYLARRLNDLSYDISRETSKIDFTLLLEGARQTLGFVYPVYSWGVPPVMERFIESIPEDVVEKIRHNRIPVWMVATCGDETGNAPEMFRNIMRRRGLGVKGLWSVIMPNTYVLLPGFDVDSDEVRRRKLADAPAIIESIAGKINGGVWEENVIYGSMPALKTRIVFPLFRRWGIFPGRWRAGDECVSCGKCASVCPVNNISLKDGRPHWKNDCVSCLACYHECPVHAVQYGSATRSKGQYPPDQRPRFE